MLRCGTEHDHLVAASRLDDIGDDHRDVIDATFVESLDDEALRSVVRQAVAGLPRSRRRRSTPHTPSLNISRSPATTGTVARSGSLVGCPFSTFSSSERWGCIAASFSLIFVIDEVAPRCDRA